jgi:ABC-2 type transport system permease protein
MTLLAVERIKLFSTRSPWWSMLLALVVTVGFAALTVGTEDDAAWITVPSTQFGYSFGLAVILVMAALTITTEYRFNTIKTLFQAVPSRTSALLAKTIVVAVATGVLGLIAAFGSLGIAMVLQPDANLALNSAADWRAVGGVALVFAIASVVAIAVGILIRHTAGAVAILLTYALMAENLVQLIPDVGDDIHKWLPFNVAYKFISGDPDLSGRPVQAGPPPSDATLSPWWALAYFAAFALVMLTIAIITAKKRDA